MQVVGKWKGGSSICSRVQLTLNSVKVPEFNEAMATIPATENMYRFDPPIPVKQMSVKTYAEYRGMGMINTRQEQIAIRAGLRNPGGFPEGGVYGPSVQSVLD